MVAQYTLFDHELVCLGKKKSELVNIFSFFYWDGGSGGRGIRGKGRTSMLAPL